MNATQLQLAQQIESLKQQYQAIAAGSTTYTASQLQQMQNLHAKAIALTDQLQAAGWDGPNPEGQDAATWAATIAASTSGGAPGNNGGGGGSTTTTTSTTTGGTSTATLSGIGGAISGFFGSIGSAFNTITGSTGQTRASQWVNILAVPILLVAAAFFIGHSYWRGPGHRAR